MKNKFILMCLGLLCGITFSAAAPAFSHVYYGHGGPKHHYCHNIHHKPSIGVAFYNEGFHRHCYYEPGFYYNSPIIPPMYNNHACSVRVAPLVYMRFGI